MKHRRGVHNRGFEMCPARRIEPRCPADRSTATAARRSRAVLSRLRAPASLYHGRRAQTEVLVRSWP